VVCERPQDTLVTLPVRALPGEQLIVRVLEHVEPKHTHREQELVQVVAPLQEPVPPAPLYCPQVPLAKLGMGELLGVGEGEGVGVGVAVGVGMTRQPRAEPVPAARV
jgi:hypothetical protein